MMTTEDLIFTVDEIYRWDPDYADYLDNICDEYGIDAYTTYQMIIEKD